MFSYQHRFIFAHIPKCGGTSIRRWLFEMFQDPLLTAWADHLTLADMKKGLLPEVFDSALRFAFVRNPWDRLVSNYFFTRDPSTSQEYHQMAMEMSFKEYQYKSPPMPSQLMWLTDYKGQILANYLGRYETFEEDALKIAERLGVTNPPPLPRSNSSTHDYYTKYYDRELEEFVGRRYKKEIERFGYEFKARKLF